MGNNLEKISAKLEGNEQLALDSMLQGESVVETAHSLAVSVQEAQALRKAVYCAAEEFVEFGSNTKEKQQKLIDFCKQDETKEIKIATANGKIVDVHPASVKESIYAYYALFEHMANEHNLTLLESELQQIYNIVNKDLENDIQTRINENNKLRAELGAVQEKLKPFEEDYFKGLTYEAIAELAKKSNRLTKENSKLIKKIEQIEKIELPKITDDGLFFEISNKANNNIQAIGGLFFKICEMLNLNPNEVNLEDAAEEIELLKQRPLEKPDFGNFLVFNPEKGSPNKVYKDINRAIEDAKSVARKEQDRVFVLRIDSVITPHCSFDVQDVSKSGISSKNMQKDEIPF